MRVEKHWQSWFVKLDGYEQAYWDELIEKLEGLMVEITGVRAELNRLEQRARNRERRGR